MGPLDLRIAAPSAPQRTQTSPGVRPQSVAAPASPVQSGISAAPPQARLSLHAAGSGLTSLSFVDEPASSPPGDPSPPGDSSPAGERLQGVQTAVSRSREAYANLISLASDLRAGRATETTSPFAAAFAALAPQEQDVAIAVLGELGAHPPAAGFRERIRAGLEGLPRERQMALGRALNQAGVSIPGTVPGAPTAEDLSSRIQSMVIPAYDSGEGKGYAGNGEDIRDYVRDLVAVAHSEGFTLLMPVGEASSERQTTLRQRIVSDLGREGYTPDEARTMVEATLRFSDGDHYVWGEDNKTFTVDGQLLTHAKLDKSTRDAVRSFVSAKSGATPAENMEGWHPLTDDGVTSFQGAVFNQNADDLALDLADKLGVQARRTRTSNEYGNLLVGSLPNGEPYALVGRDGLLLSARNLSFSESDLAAAKAALSASPAEITQVATRLQASGQVPAGHTPESAARDLLARLDLTKPVFAQDLGIPAANLVFVDQPDFHIDMYLRPLGPGQVMINDIPANLALLEQAQARTSDPAEARVLENMAASERQKLATLQPVMDRIARQLEAAGLQVLRAPGVMEEGTVPLKDSDPEPTRVNFMNAVPGTSPGSARRFVMANHASPAPLREAYETYLRAQGVDEIHWIGDSLFKYLEAAPAFTSATATLGTMGGLDCRENRLEYR